MSVFIRASVLWLLLGFGPLGLLADEGITANSDLKELIRAQMNRTTISSERMAQITSRILLNERGEIALFGVSKTDDDLTRANLIQLGFSDFVVEESRFWLSLALDDLAILATQTWLRYLTLAPTPTAYEDEIFNDQIIRGNTTRTQGFKRVNATEYHNAGYRGQGVKIGIIDTGFDDLARIISEGEAVQPARQYSCTATGGCTTVTTVEASADSPHGTACFEIIYDFAPEATYYLVQLGNGRLIDAVDVLANEGVHVISTSLGWNVSSGPTDERDLFMLNAAVTRARQNGILMVFSAGNFQQFFYNGTFTDSDGDNRHEFKPKSFFGLIGPDEDIKIKLKKDAKLIMNWDEWGAGNLTGTQIQDGYRLIACQNGTCLSFSSSNQYPVIEAALTKGTYEVRVERTGTDGSPKSFRLQLSGDQRGEVEQFNAGAPSITSPKESTKALSVGAVNARGIFSVDDLEDYSSQGPGGNGAIKPDVVSYANVSTLSYGNSNRFNGTSSAAPHVAGMAAVVISLNSQARGSSIDFLAPGSPGLGYFQRNAKSRGGSTANNQYGWGIARLPLINDPLVNLITPTTISPANVLENAAGERINLTFSVFSEGGDFLGGLERGELSVRVGSAFATINSLIQLEDRYVANIDLPVQSAGEYDLRVGVEINRKTGSDTNADAVIYASSTTVNVDTMLVIDRSGSMGGSAISSARNAAQLFVDLTSDGDQIGVASYSSSSRVDFPLSAIGPNDPRPAIKSAISAINASGGTSIGAGLQDALDEFLRSGDASHPWTGVILTDGFENASPSVSSVLPAVLNTRMRLFTIGLGSSVDENLLRQMAQDTGGQYFNAPTNNELQAIYGSISGEVLDRETLIDRTATLDEGQTIREPFFIDRSTSEAFVSISWPIQGDDIELRLTSPSGLNYTSASQNPDVVYQEGPTFASYRLINPEAGRWQMEIRGISVTRQVEPVWLRAFEENDRSILDDLLDEDLRLIENPSRGFNSAPVTLQVQADTDLEMDVLADKERYQAGETMELRVFLNNNDPLKVLTSVTAVVVLPNGDEVSAGQFRDDGMAGDDFGDDGVFTGRFNNTGQIGNYRVQVFASGVTPDLQDFERLSSFATVVDPGADRDFDGMPDAWEFRWAIEGDLPLNPFVDDAFDDFDEDGLTNLEEFQRGTHPLREDSDGDGLTDGDEVNQSLTDPSADDTDGGGERDGAEVAAGRDPLNAEDDVPCILGAESEQLFYVQGVDPITFAVQFTCVRLGMTLEYVNTRNGQVLGADQNPFMAPSLFTGPTDVELRFTGSFAAESQSTRLRVLASQNPRYRDYDNDGCNTRDDLLGVIADAWNQPLQNGGDADGDGVFSLLDLFFINTDGCSNREVHSTGR